MILQPLKALSNIEWVTAKVIRALPFKEGKNNGIFIELELPCGRSLSDRILLNNVFMECKRRNLIRATRGTPAPGQKVDVAVRMGYKMEAHDYRAHRA